MKKFLFVSRHQANEDQVRLAFERNVELVQVEDLDAFRADLALKVSELAQDHGAVGIVAVHPLIALAGYEAGLAVGSFRNINRAPIGEKPQFGTDLLKIVGPY